MGNKALVVFTAQVSGERIERIRLGLMPNASSQSLLPFVKSAIEPGSRVIRDGWEGYEGLSERAYKHKMISGSGKTTSGLLPRVHRVASPLKRWMLATHQGAVSREQMDYYLDEFTFRFNRRTSKSRGKPFYRLAEQAVAIERVPFSALSSSWQNSNHGVVPLSLQESITAKLIAQRKTRM